MMLRAATRVRVRGSAKSLDGSTSPLRVFYSGLRRWITTRAVFQLSGNILKTGDRPDRECFDPKDMLEVGDPKDMLKGGAR